MREGKMGPLRFWVSTQRRQLIYPPSCSTCHQRELPHPAFQWYFRQLVFGWGSAPVRALALRNCTKRMLKNCLLQRNRAPKLSEHLDLVFSYHFCCYVIYQARHSRWPYCLAERWSKIRGQTVSPFYRLSELDRKHYMWSGIQWYLVPGTCA